MTLTEVIQDNRWSTAQIMKTTAVNNLFKSGIITRAGEQAKAFMNALNFENVQDTITVGMVDAEWAEQNLGDASDDKATGIEPIFDEARAKTFYGNQWWTVRTIQKDLMNATKPYTLVGNKVGEYWATMWNRILSATVSGMSDIAEITVGDGTKVLDRLLVVDAMTKKGDMGFGKLGKLHMNSKTFAYNLKKQIEAGDILFTREKAQVQVGADGRVVQYDTEDGRWVYDGSTEIVIDDTMKDGIISLISKGAFVLEAKEVKKPLLYVNDPLAGNGAGKEMWGTKMIYILHPLGFDMKGQVGTDYDNKSGLTLAELQGGGLYDLKVDAKLAPITNLKVKYED